MTSEISKDRVLSTEAIPGGAAWSAVLPRFHTLRVTDVEGGANVSMLLYNRELPIERYNMADTLKAQHTAFLTRGFVLYSDMGRVLCSIPEDSCGWHDTVTGMSDETSVVAQYGTRRYGDLRNQMYRNARELMLIELGKWGLGRRDLAPNVNLFTKVVADEGGELRYVSGNSAAGSFIDLRAEMNVLVVLTTCPHPYDPATRYAPKPIALTLWKSDPPGPEDPCRRSRAENERGFANTERSFLGMG